MYHLSNFSVVSVDAETKFETSKTFATTFITVVYPIEAVLYHLSNFSVVSVFAETKFGTPQSFVLTFISGVQLLEAVLQLLSKTETQTETDQKKTIINVVRLELPTFFHTHKSIIGVKKFLTHPMVPNEQGVEKRICLYLWTR